MAHVFLLEEHRRNPASLFHTAHHHRVVLTAAAFAAAAAAFGSYSLEHRGAPPAPASCVTSVGALGTYGIANGDGATSNAPGCSAD